MLISKQNTTHFYLLCFIKSIILFLFLLYTYKGFKELNFEYNLNDNSGVFGYLRMMFNRKYLRPVSILFLPFIGIFLNKKIGWIFMTSYFYFFFFKTLFSLIFEISDDILTLEIILFLLAILFSILFIFLMNLRIISSLTYNIPKSQLGNTNTIASLLGISLTILLTLDIADII